MNRVTLLTLIAFFTIGVPALNAGGPADQPRSENFQLKEFTPNGGQQKMASERFRMEMKVTPIPARPLHSPRFRIVPLKPEDKRARPRT